MANPEPPLRLHARTKSHQAFVLGRSRGNRTGWPRFIWAFLSSSCLITASPSALAADDWLGPDKALHFGLSAALAGGGYAASSWLWEPKLERAVMGFGVAVTLGATKEGYDALGNGQASGKDFAWDVAGALVGAALALTIDTLFFDAGPEPNSTGATAPTNPTAPTAIATLRF